MKNENDSYTQFREEYSVIEDAILNLEAGMDDLRSARAEYDRLDKNYYNTFSDKLEFTDKDANVLKSGMCYSSVEIAIRGMLFPTFRVETMDKSGYEEMNAASVAKSLIEWVQRESGFINAFQDSKEEWAKSGDGYRRPYLEPIGGNKYWPQYETLDPRNIILDPESKMAWSKNVAISASFWGHTEILDEKQMKRRFGKEVIKYVKPGAMVDVDSLTKKAGKNTRPDKKYYEVIEYQDCADGVELVLLGENAFPAKIVVDGEKQKVKKKYKGLILSSGTYIHKTRTGKKELSLHNTIFYYDKKRPRNLGLVKRLAPVQYADERMENLKLEAAQLKMFEIPTVAGGREDLVRGAIQEFVEERRSNVFAVLHAPSGIEGVVPKFDVLRFQGVTAEEGTATTRDLYTLARNTVGIDLTRLEVQANVTLGQSQLIEQEKLDTLETRILDNKPILEHEYEAILDFAVNNDGFGLKNVKISCDYYGKMKGVTSGKEVELIGKRELSIVEATRELKDTRVNVIIDDSSLVNRTYVALLDSWIKLLGVVNPQITPDLYKFILKRIGESGRFDVPDNILEGVEKQDQAQGGASQFKSQTQGAPAPTPGQMPQDAAADPMSALMAGDGGGQASLPPIQ